MVPKYTRFRVLLPDNTPPPKSNLWISLGLWPLEFVINPHPAKTKIVLSVSVSANQRLKFLYSQYSSRSLAFISGSKSIILILQSVSVSANQRLKLCILGALWDLCGSYFCILRVLLNFVVNIPSPDCSTHPPILFQIRLNSSHPSHPCSILPLSW